MWCVNFKKQIAIIFFPWLLSILIPFFGRLFLLLSFVDVEQIILLKRDVIRLFLVGLLFDLRITNIVFGLVIILGFFTLFSGKWSVIWQKLLMYYSLLILVLVTIFTVVNIFYYITYDRHIDVFIFGLFDDDTIAIIKTIWSDYPVIKLVLALIVMVYLFYRLTLFCYKKAIAKKYHQHSSLIELISIFFLLIFIVIGARGSVSTFPLRESDAQISQYDTFNKFVPNGIIALSWAYKAYKIDLDLNLISDMELNELLQRFFDKNDDNSIEIFQDKTDYNFLLEQQPPNVVFVVMESMGTHLFQFDDKIHRDLMGSLRKHWENDWVFDRFISEGDGTIDSLNRFFVRSPIDKISQSFAQHVEFKSNMFQPFKNKGYKIIYITAGNGAWRNLNQFLMHLGVDEFIEQNTLLNEYPEAELSTWGVPDEYMFKFAEKRLSEAKAKNEHVFIMMMSITNHPPYQLPKNNEYHDYEFSDSELKRFRNMNNLKELKNMFNTFRYSNEKLGNFIDWVKSSNLSNQTIIAVTGDHNLRGIGYSDPKELALSHAVPFYLYVPQKYQNNTVYDLNRIGSHKDILPTLYHLSLSEADYYNTGCNLLTLDPNSFWCNIGYNPNVVIDQKGAYSLSNNTFSSWKNLKKLELNEPTDFITEEQILFIERWQSWGKLLHWQIIEQIKH